MSGDTITRQGRFTNAPELLTLDTRLSDRAFRLWCRLDRFAGDKESAFPLRETLCVELDCSLASIDRALAELVDAGWLRKERQSAGDRNRYTLMVAAPRGVEKARAEEIERRKARWLGQRKPKADENVADQPENGASSQVNPEGGVTSEDTGPGVTSDDTLASPVTTPGVMGDAYKEASSFETSEKDTSPENPGDGAATSKRRGRPPVQEVPRPDVDELCALLADLIEGNKNLRPTITKDWRTECRLMLDRDGRDPVKARKLIEWCQGNQFWRKNILSMPKFREQYDRLRMDANDEHFRALGRTRGGPQQGRPLSDAEIRDRALNPHTYREAQ